MNKQNRWLLGLWVLVPAVMLLALLMGSAPMDLPTLLGGLLGRPGYETQSLILYQLRLPRALGALLAGSGLALSGLLLQKATSNGLAGPNIIGVNAGAGLGVALTLFLAPAAFYVLPVAAFIGAFLTTLLIVGVANRLHRSSTAVVLAGVAISALLNAVISFISLLEPDLLDSYNHFSIGGVSGVQLRELLLPGLLILLCAVVARWLARPLNSLSLGDPVAASLGVRVKATRTLCLILASASAAAAVSVAGLLGFVGLIVPHMARRIAPGAFRTQVALCLLLGGILVVAADLLGRVLLAPTELPVGILTALLGVPFFFYLLVKGGENHVDL